MFVRLCKKYRELDKVLDIRIETIHNTRKQNTLSLRAFPFFYSTIGEEALIFQTSVTLL